MTWNMNWNEWIEVNEEKTECREAYKKNQKVDFGDGVLLWFLEKNE